jgi:predicted AAA+ superfamily ATPase
VSGSLRILHLTTSFPSNPGNISGPFIHDEKIECDFIARGEDDRLSAMQVSLELNEKSREREVNGLLKACKWLATDVGVIFKPPPQLNFFVAGRSVPIIFS